MKFWKPAASVLLLTIGCQSGDSTSTPTADGGADTTAGVSQAEIAQVTFDVTGMK